MSCPCRMLAPICLFTILCVFLGCGSGEKDNLVPVTGKVTFDGKPVTKGSVSFRGDKARGSTTTAEPYGVIASDGTYTLYTNKKPGAPPGKYAVVVVSTEDNDPANPSATPKSLIPEKYGDPGNPILQVDIVEDPKAGKYDLALTK